MSQGYLSEKREQQLAAILDASIDFNVVLGKQKKVLGIFSLGNFMERNDRKVFKYMIEILDNKVLGKDPKPEVVDLIEKTLDLLASKNFKGFSEFVAEVMSNKIETPFEAFEKQIFTSVLLMFNGLIGQAVQKIEEKLKEAETEK